MNNSFEDERWKERCRKWGMCDKDDDDHTIEDAVKDLQALRTIHGERIKGVIIIPVYEYYDMMEFDKEHENDEYIDKPPCHYYLCSGNIPKLECVGALEFVKSLTIRS